MSTRTASATGLAERATAGLLWTTAQKWVVRISALVTVVILARLLTPEDFGLVAVALSVVPAVYLLADLGFSTYLVQAAEPSRRTFSTAFWYSSVSGVLLAAGLWLVGPLMEALLGTPGVAAVLAGLAPAVVFVAVGAVPLARLRRELRFRALALQGFVAAVAGQAVAIALAVTGFGVWALVAQTVVMQVVTTVMAWGAARWWPSWTFSLREFVEMVKYGSNVIAVELIALTRLWAENAIIAATLGLTGLGYLNIAQRLIQVAQDLTASAITPVTTVVFAQIRAHAPRLASGYLRAQGVVYAVVIPIMVFILTGAGDLIPLLFGSQWQASVLPAQALAVAGILTVGAALDQALFYGIGRPGRWLAYAVVVDALTVAVTAILAPFGLVAVAYGFVGVATVATAARIVLVARAADARTGALASQFLRALILGAVVAAAGFAAAALTAGLASIPALLIVGVTISVVWLVILRWVMPATAGEVNRQLAAITARVRRRLPRVGERLPRSVSR